VTHVPPATVTTPGAPEITTLPAEIDIRNADRTGRELSAALRPGVTAVIADLTQTTFAGSSAIRALLEAHNTTAASHAELRLVIPPGPVQRTLQITTPDRRLLIYPTLNAALSSPAPASA
jgi:anti-sigma B factor antagonist